MNHIHNPDHFFINFVKETQDYLKGMEKNLSEIRHKISAIFDWSICNLLEKNYLSKISPLTKQKKFQGHEELIQLEDYKEAFKLFVTAQKLNYNCVNTSMNSITEEIDRGGDGYNQQLEDVVKDFNLSASIFGFELDIIYASKPEAFSFCIGDIKAHTEEL